MKKRLAKLTLATLALGSLPLLQGCTGEDIIPWWRPRPWAAVGSTTSTSSTGTAAGGSAATGGSAGTASSGSSIVTSAGGTSVSGGSVSVGVVQ